MNKILHPVINRGSPPPTFLKELLAWAATEDLAVFAPNDNPTDIFASIKETLGTKLSTGRYVWDSIDHRRAALMEVMRVHAGFESSWNWREGVDVTNRTSQRDINGQETGIFQVSFNSTWLKGKAMEPFALANGIGTPHRFIERMKEDHALALRYYALLSRVSVAWAGPILRHELHPELRRDAMEEFMGILSTGWTPPRPEAT